MKQCSCYKIICKLLQLTDISAELGRTFIELNKSFFNLPCYLLHWFNLYPSYEILIMNESQIFLSLNVTCYAFKAIK